MPGVKGSVFEVVEVSTLAPAGSETARHAYVNVCSAPSEAWHAAPLSSSKAFAVTVVATPTCGCDVAVLTETTAGRFAPHRLALIETVARGLRRPLLAMPTRPTTYVPGRSLVNEVGLVEVAVSEACAPAGAVRTVHSAVSATLNRTGHAV